jgi:hypothetical protein
MSVPPTAPPTMEPASTAVRIHFFAMFISCHLLSRLFSEASVAAAVERSLGGR